LSLYGSKSSPVIKLQDTSTITLSNAFDRVIDILDESEIRESDIDGERIPISRDMLIRFTCHINMFNNVDAPPDFDDLHNDVFLNSVYVKAHGDGTYFQNSTPADALFYCDVFDPYYMDTGSYHDKLKLSFISKEPIDMGALVTIYWDAEDGRNMITEDGKRIILG